MVWLTLTTFKWRVFPFTPFNCISLDFLEKLAIYSEVRLRARAGLSPFRHFHMVICPKIAGFGPKSLFFKNFVRLAPKYIYIVKITFLAQILNVFPLYGCWLPLKGSCMNTKLPLGSWKFTIYENHYLPTLQHQHVICLWLQILMLKCQELLILIVFTKFIFDNYRCSIWL